MFKVPAWGTDVPTNNINFGKTSHTKKGIKSTVPIGQDLPVNPRVNGNIQKRQTAKKSTDKRKLKKVRKRNREIYQMLSKPQYNEPKLTSYSQEPGKFVLNPNKIESKDRNSELVLSKVERQKRKPTKPKRPKPIKSPKQNNQKQNVLNNTNGTETIKPRKRKRNSNNDIEMGNIELNNVDTDKADELIINAKKKKLNDAFKNEDQEDVLFSEKPIIKFHHKKDRIKKMLAQNSNRNSVNVSGNSSSLRERMIAKLQAAQFRYLNEKLYTSSGSEAKQLFQSDPAAFDTYHQGYQQQIKKWPVNPLDIIVKRIMKMPKTHIVADMGCGSATLSKRVPHAVRSFDLVAAAPGVEVCDMAHSPLLSASVDVVVYCLALMGTQLAEYLAEGNRVLKTGGHLLIAEVESRFDKLEDFTHGVERLGFKLLKTDQTHQVFYFMEFKKIQEASKKARHVPLTLKPCLYKRR